MTSLTPLCWPVSPKQRSGLFNADFFIIAHSPWFSFLLNHEALHTLLYAVLLGEGTMCSWEATNLSPNTSLPSFRTLLLRSIWLVDHRSAETCCVWSRRKAAYEEGIHLFDYGAWHFRGLKNIYDLGVSESFIRTWLWLSSAVATGNFPIWRFGNSWWKTDL